MQLKIQLPSHQKQYNPKSHHLLHPITNVELLSDIFEISFRYDIFSKICVYVCMRVRTYLVTLGLSCIKWDL